MSESTEQTTIDMALAENTPEPEIDDAFSAAFARAAGGDSAPATPAPAVLPPKATTEEPESPADVPAQRSGEVTDTKEPESGETPDDDADVVDVAPDVRSEVERLGEELLARQAAEKPEETASKPPEPPTPETVTPKQLAMPESFTLDGEEYSLKEVSELYPGLTAYLQAATQTAAQELFRQAVDNGQFVPSGKLDERLAPMLEQVKQVDELRQKVEYNDFLDAVAEGGVEDVRKILRSPSWTAWLEKQSPAVLALVDSGDVDYSVKALQLYKHEQAQEGAKKIDEERAKEKQRKDNLHRHTTRDARTGKFAEAAPEKTYAEAFSDAVRRLEG